MGDYVDRKRLKEAIREDALNCLSCYNGEVLNLVLTEIDEASAADVRPVVRGYWEFPIFMDSDTNDPRCKCSVCGSIETPLARHKFCPNCGADMRGESEQ